MVADNQVLRLLETATGREIEILETYEKPISDVAYSPNGEGIASIDIQGVVRLWRRKEAAVTVRDASNRKADFSLLFSPDGKQIIVGASNIEVWEYDDGQLVGEWRTNSHVTTLALHPDGDQLAVGTEDGEIELWLLERGERVGVIDGKDIKTDPPRSNVTVESLAFERDGAILIAGFQDAVIAVWDTENHTLLRSWITKTEPDAEFKGWGVSGISPNYEIRRWPAIFALSPDSRTVAALADRFTNVGYWDVETGKLIGKLDSYSTYYLRMLGFSADGTRFGTLSTSVHVWDTTTKQIIAEMQYDNGGSAAALSPNGNYVAITHRDRRITVWDVNTATVKHVLRGGIWGGTWYWTVAFSPDSRFVAAVALSPIIRVWEVETGKLIAELNHWGDSLDFGSVHFSPDGKWLVAGGGALQFGKRGDLRCTASSEKLKTFGEALSPSVQTASGLLVTQGFHPTRRCSGISKLAQSIWNCQRASSSPRNLAPMEDGSPRLNGAPTKGSVMNTTPQ